MLFAIQAFYQSFSGETLMSLKKVTLASLILLGLTACGSGGGSSSNTNNNVALEEVEKKLAVATDELKNLKAENQANTEALEKAKAELIQAQENLKSVQADKNATDTALLEAQNKLKIAEESKARILSELNAQISQKNTQIAQLSSEITQIKNDLNLANANLIKAQTDLKAVENDKTKTVTELTAAQGKLKEAETAKATAENKLAGKQRVIDAIHSQILQLENTYYNLGYKHHSEYPLGFHKTANISISPAVENVGDGILTADQYIYKQIFSSVLARATKDSSMWDDTNSPRFRVDGVVSDLVTETLPNEGSATYTGKAFHADQLGILTYNVNFKERTGEGKLSGFDKFADITLEKGNIENIPMKYQNTDVQGIKSNASMADGTTGKYELGFFGPNAEEIAGEAYIFKHLDGSFKSNGRSAEKYGYAPERGTMFGFGGTRSELQK